MEYNVGTDITHVAEKDQTIRIQSTIKEKQIICANVKDELIYAQLNAVLTQKENGTYDHNLLQNRDAENQHPVSAINGLSELLDQKIDGDKIGNGLKYEDGILSIDTADTVEQDNTKPVTSAAVYTEIGNIEALLANI